MPECVADQSLAEAQAQIDDSERDDGGADPKAPAREFRGGLPKPDLSFVALGPDDHEQGQGCDYGAPELADISELIERHSVESAHHVERQRPVTGRLYAKRNGKHQQEYPPQDRARQTGLFGEVERAQTSLAMSQFDRALCHHQESMQ